MSIFNRTFVVKYPPSYDGELHIHTAVKTDTIGKTMTMNVTLRMNPGETEKDALLRLAKDIQRAQ